MQTDGILCIDKPAGMSSFGVVARIRRVLSMQAGKKVKVGHTGTLDPFATGLMILVIGTECRNAQQYAKLDKWYETTIVLGATSTTGDPEGEIVPVHGAEPVERTRIDHVVRQYIGDIMQTPPAYSAIKINGQRAYKLARAGQTVDMPSRQVTIYTCEVLHYTYPELKLRVHVSSGTYIRTLAQDIGTALGVGAYCQALRRTQIAEYRVDEARRLEDFGIVS